MLGDSISIDEHVSLLVGNVLSCVIDQGAYCLGMHVLSAMARLNVQQVALVPLEQVTALRHNNFVSGPFRPDSAKEFMQALQLLHFRAGILNSFIESDLADPGNHFTLRINTTYQRTWGEQTPLIFRRGGEIRVYPEAGYVRFGC